MVCSHHQGNHFEPLTHVHDRKSRWFAGRRRAREHKRKRLVDFQLATLDADLSSRVDDVIKANKDTSNVQLPELDFSPMQMVKWEPSTLSPAPTSPPRFQPVSDADWSNLEIFFSHPPKKDMLAPLPTPPTSLWTAAELGLFTPSPPRVSLSELVNNCRVATPSVRLPVVAPWMSDPPMAPRSDLNSPRLDTPEYDDDVSSSFVAAKLPQFRDIDPFDLTADLTFEAKPIKSGSPNHKPQSTRCILWHEEIEHDLEEEFSRSLRQCEEGRVPALAPNDSSDDKTDGSKVDWSDQPVMDWPYDALDDWNNEPFIGWDVEPAADWTDDPTAGWSDEAVMIEHDTEMCDWTLLSLEDEASGNSVSMLNSASPSTKVLSLPLRDPFQDNPSAYEEPVHKLTGDDMKMRRISKSAWESESDFCIPAFF